MIGYKGGETMVEVLDDEINLLNEEEFQKRTKNMKIIKHESFVIGDEVYAFILEAQQKNGQHPLWFIEIKTPKDAFYLLVEYRHIIMFKYIAGTLSPEDWRSYLSTLIHKN